MNKATLGWAFVAVQAILLAALVFLPGRDDWMTPTWLRLIGYLAIGAGLVLAAVAALGLGRSLTPTPVPVEHGQLTTDGLYRFMRHPIYTGVLAVVIGLTLRSGSFVHLGVAVATAIFFNRKAMWEEQQLAQRYEGYAAYAEETPRFIPAAHKIARRNSSR